MSKPHGVAWESGDLAGDVSFVFLQLCICPHIMSAAKSSFSFGKIVLPFVSERQDPTVFGLVLES